jgi:hypothetical protein
VLSSVLLAALRQAKNTKATDKARATENTRFITASLKLIHTEFHPWLRGATSGKIPKLRR